MVCLLRSANRQTTRLTGLKTAPNQSQTANQSALTCGFSFSTGLPTFPGPFGRAIKVLNVGKPVDLHVP
jgi:hypothetical protein